VLFASQVNKLGVSEEAVKDALTEDNARVEAGPDAPEVAQCLEASSCCAAVGWAETPRTRPGSIATGGARGRGVCGGRGQPGGDDCVRRKRTL